MWGTSLAEDKLAGDLGNVIGATSIGGRPSDFFYSKKIGAGQFGTFATMSASNSNQGGHSQRNVARARERLYAQYQDSAYSITVLRVLSAGIISSS
jgi:hypothetical protein